MTLDDKVTQAQERLRASMTPSPPISTAEGEPLRRVYITGGDSEVQGPDGSPYSRPFTPQELQSDPTVGAGVTNALPEATPEDNTQAQLAARREQAIQALKDQDGFDGYTSEIGNLDTPEAQQGTMKAITDIAAGFNASLARTLSLPREVVDRGMGMLGLDYMERGGPQQQTIDALNRMGIPAYEVETLANKIGQGALPALATWATMQLAAPAMAANQGMGTFGFLARNMGEWMMKHPVVGLWLGQTAQAGGETAVHATGSDNLAVRFSGELAGGIAPGAVKAAATLPFKAASAIPGVAATGRAAKQAMGSGINAISNALPQELGNVIRKYNPFYTPGTVNPEPLVGRHFDTNRLNTFAQDQVAAAQHYQDLAIERALSSIQRSGSSGQASIRTHQLLQNAEKISKRIVSSFWARVPEKTKMDVRELRNDVYAFRKNLTDKDNQRPDAMLDKVVQVVRLRQEEGSGKIIAPKPTLAKLRDLQSQIGTAITEERAKDAPREGMVRNLYGLSNLIDDAIARSFPNNTSIAQARAISKRHNDLFSRGPIDAVLSKRRSGDFRVPQADAVDSLMTRTDGLQALKDVQEGVAGHPTARFVAKVTQAEKQQLDEMIRAATDSIRNSFREAGEQGAEKAVAYSQKNEDAIRALGNVAGELQFAAQKVVAALNEKKAVNASALARFAQFDGAKAVQNIYAQRNPAETAKQLMVSFRGDPDALEGLRNQVLTELIYTKGQMGNPNIIRRLMDDPKIGNMLQAVLSPEQYGRLDKMVNTAVRIGVEDAEGMRQFFRAPARTAGRLTGAMIGRRLAPNTLQGPSIFANAMGKTMERTLQGTDPQDLLSQAVLDPNWEKLLYSRIPQTTKEARDAIIHYRRAFSALNSAEQRALKRFQGEEKEDE